MSNLYLHLAGFIGCAAVIVFSGTKLTKYGDKIAELTGWGNACPGTIKQVSPNYEFPHSLASTVLLAMKHQLYYAKHLPTLSDIKYDPKKQYKRLYVLLENIVFKSIQ